MGVPIGADRDLYQGVEAYPRWGPASVLIYIRLDPSGEAGPGVAVGNMTVGAPARSCAADREWLLEGLRMAGTPA